MNVKLLTDYYLKSLSLKGGCTGLSEPVHVKMPHCWKSHVMAQFLILGISWLGVDYQCLSMTEVG